MSYRLRYYENPFSEVMYRTIGVRWNMCELIAKSNRHYSEYQLCNAIFDFIWEEVRTNYANLADRLMLCTLRKVQSEKNGGIMIAALVKHSIKKQYGMTIPQLHQFYNQYVTLGFTDFI